MATAAKLGKPHESKRWLVLHPAKEVKVVLETLVLVMEVVSLGMTTLVMEETSVVTVVLVAAVVVVDMVAVGMAIMDLVVQEAWHQYVGFRKLPFVDEGAPLTVTDSPSLSYAMLHAPWRHYEI
ncbi:hypothetical protein AAY473_006905 [Plecturocebus cupreus]